MMLWEVMARDVPEVLIRPVTLGSWVPERRITERLVTEELPWAVLCHHVIVTDRLF